MRRIGSLLLLLLLLGGTAFAAPLPAHLEVLAPRSWLTRGWNSLQQFLPRGLRGDLRDRARALAAAHDAYLREHPMSIADSIAAAATMAPSTIQRVDYRGNRVVGAPLAGGRAITAGMVRLIGTARHEVVLQSFIFEDSWMAQQLRAAIEALPPNVKVRVLVHPRRGYGFGLGPGLLGENPWRTRRRLRRLLPFDHVEIGVWKPGDLVGTAALHTKGVVVDGRRALVVDSNVQKNVDPLDEGGRGWFQLGMEVEGPIAGGLRTDAMAAFGDEGARASGRRVGSTRMILLGKQAGSGGRNSAAYGYASLFLSARKKLRAISPNLNDSAAVLSLAAATAHSDVYLVLSKGFNERAEWLLQGGGNARNLRRLRALAADPSRLHVRWYADEAGIVPIGNNSRGPSHAKWASADGRVMVLGSQNLDTQSWKRSREVSVAVDDAEATAGYDAIFDGIWARSRDVF
jgi:phosphatidylserine/phosphatidylglycerophosphate/cardiolipin synthase-like enzyme